MATYVPAKKNTAFIFYASLISQANTKIMKVNPTLAAGDFKVSIDGGTLNNLATLPTVTPAAGSMVKFSLSAGEMNGDNITVVCLDAAGAEWCDLTINIQTAARQIEDLAYPATSGRSMVVDAAGLVDANMVKMGPSAGGTAQTARDIGLSVLLAAGAITASVVATDAIDADALAADAITEIWAKALADSVPADGALPTALQALYMIVQFLTERSVSGTVLTVKKVDGSTALMTFTLDDAGAPTAITRAT